MALFGRVVRLVIGPAGGQGIEIDNLRIGFEITKTLSKNPNSSTVRIWNLARSSRELIQKPDTRCLLYAGYEEDRGPLLIFNGAVSFAFSAFDGPDVVTECELGDGALEIRDTLVSLGYGAGASSDAILRDIARRMGLALVIADDALPRTWAHGFSFYGPARAALDRVTHGSGARWSIQNGELQVVRTGGTTTRQAIVLALDSGLIGHPERERKGRQEAATVRDADTARRRRIESAQQQQDGWSVRSLLQPTILPGDPVILRSRSVEGTFRVSELRHVGDTHEGDFMTEMKLVDKLPPPGGQQRR